MSNAINILYKSNNEKESEDLIKYLYNNGSHYKEISNLVEAIIDYRRSFVSKKPYPHIFAKQIFNKESSIGCYLPTSITRLIPNVITNSPRHFVETLRNHYK